MSATSPTTRKLLVAFDPSNLEDTGDFVVPISGTNGVRFFGLRSHRLQGLGQMVFVGSEVTVNELFAKLVDSGSKIPDVENTVKMLTEYVAQLQEYKIGNVLSMESVSGGRYGFRLTKVANTPSGAVKTIE